MSNFSGVTLLLCNYVVREHVCRCSIVLYVYSSKLLPKYVSNNNQILFLPNYAFSLLEMLNASFCEKSSILLNSLPIDLPVADKIG